jgi:two-component SAPR family response regulator
MIEHNSAIVVRCLGEFAMDLHGVPVGRWRAGRARSLFQYLLLQRGRLVRRDRLYETLWPDTVWSPGSSSLKVAVHALRGVLDTAGGGSGTGKIEILSQGSGYLMRGTGIWVDFEEFEAAADAGAQAEARGDTAEMLNHLHRAADLYRDDFLPDEDADWAVEQREWLRGRALRAFESLRSEAGRRRDAAGLAHWAQRILRVDPYHEETYRVLMLMHGRRGEMGEVHRWHELCVRRLRRDLAVEPMPETTQAFQAAASRRLAPAQPVQPARLPLRPAMADA